MPLDTSKLKAGSVVKLTARVTGRADQDFMIEFDRDKGTMEPVWIAREAIEHAELISTPEPTFTDEQIEVISSKANELLNTPLACNGMEFHEFTNWLEARREKK